MKPDQWERLKRLVRLARFRGYRVELSRDRRVIALRRRRSYRLRTFETLDALEEFLAGPDRLHPDGGVSLGADRLAAELALAERFEALCDIAAESHCRIVWPAHSREPWRLRIRGKPPIVKECATLDELERELHAARDPGTQLDEPREGMR